MSAESSSQMEAPTIQLACSGMLARQPSSRYLVDVGARLGRQVSERLERPLQSLNRVKACGGVEMGESSDGYYNMLLAGMFFP